MRKIATSILQLSLLLVIGVTPFAVKGATDLRAVLTTLQDRMEKNPKDLGVRMDFAYALTEAQIWQQAEPLYRSVLQDDPKNLRAATELCVVESTLGDRELAEKYCTLTTELAPENAAAHDNLGLSRLRLGNLPGALAAFFPALALNKDSALIKVHLATALMNLREFGLARLILQSALVPGERSPENVVIVHHTLAQVLSAAGDKPAALQEMKLAAKLSGDPLFYGKVVSAFLAAHQMLAFLAIVGILLLGCRYFGQRLNRFLKNE